MVGVFARSPNARSASRRSKHFLEDRVGSKRISPAAALLSDDTPFDSFEPVGELEEPIEDDQPIQCPKPEPSIMEDGILWRARILESLRRRNDTLTAAKDREFVLRGGSIPNRRTQSRSESMESFLLEAHSAPEFEVKKLLE